MSELPQIASLKGNKQIYSNITKIYQETSASRLKSWVINVVPAWTMSLSFLKKL